jgi:MGT family glycosyltransferase
MKRRHIAIVTILGNAHVYPVLGVCSELVKRGHRVTFATNDRYAPEVRKAGAEPVIYKELRYENTDVFSKPSSFYDQNFLTIWASIVGPLGLLTAASALPQLESYYEDDRPDLILEDRSFFLGRMLAARLGCPAILFSPHFAPYNNTFIREEGRFSNPEAVLAFSKVLDCFLKAYGIENGNNLLHTADLNIYFIPREFQIHGESFDERFCFVGPCLNRPTFSTWKNNSAGRQIVLVSGSQIDGGTAYFRAMIDAFSGSNFFVVLSPGASISNDVLGTLPDNVEINRDAFNFQILPHATLVISQGGTGTIVESLYYGVPALVVPRSPLHAETAYRLAELRLGGYLPEQKMSAETINESVAQILGDAGLAGRIARMQDIVRNSGGAALAAESIDQFLHS